MNLEYQKLELKNDIQSKVQSDMNQQQREYFLAPTVENNSRRVGWSCLR
jgi:ATP-dependent Lon protease